MLVIGCALLFKIPMVVIGCALLFKVLVAVVVVTGCALLFKIPKMERYYFKCVILIYKHVRMVVHTKSLKTFRLYLL